MDQFADNYISENAALRRKLQSKAEAVLILSKELEQCRIERDQFKMMAEQVQDRYTKLKKMSPDLQSFDGGSGSRLCQVFDDLKEQNKILKLEVEDLKQKLKDAHGDMKALRAGLNQQRGGGDNSTIPSHQREELVQQLEGMGSRCTQLQSDMQALLDEKEELVMERDAYKCKVHRMNHQLCVLLRAKPSPLFDIDALVTENKYLHERLDQLKEENELAHQALVKYKSMLDKKRNKGSVRLGTNNNTNAAGMVVSHKQVQQLLECGSPSQLPNTEATLADLRSLCLALLEALQDKSLALSHQKKSNKILANRVYDLEQRLANVQDGTPVYPSQILLHDYSGSNVDKDLQLQKVHNIVSEDCIEDNNLNDADKRCEDSSCMRLTSLSSSVDDGSDTITVMIDDSSDNSSKLYQNSAIMSSNRSENPVLTSETDDLTIDVLPPQLQELVLNALQDIENNTRNGMIHS